MSRSFLEHRFERKGNTFIEDPTMHAELSAEFFATATGRFVLFDNPRSVLHRHHSSGCFIPLDLASAWEQETETSDWLKAFSPTKRTDCDSLLVCSSFVSTQQSKCKDRSDERSNSSSHDHETKKLGSQACAKPKRQNVVTTMMIQNIPNRISQRMLVDDLKRSEFGDDFDFCYAPTDFKTRLNKGFAFVNFSSPAHAESFKQIWDNSRRFGVKDSEASLRVTPAAVQGLDANLRALQKGKKARIRCPDFRPYVRDEVS
eukprot:TRINITY_DN4224_c0_g1_i10.p2 TRINITY_DN4224_c0_g1~~TRINITY_DN4224_c0_g1_i10.p2  ORF type:complete len:284 (-),score=40.94 TRINITY_DN4224_c0_g1_i10:354-1130(-)